MRFAAVGRYRRGATSVVATAVPPVHDIAGHSGLPWRPWATLLLLALAVKVGLVAIALVDVDLSDGGPSVVLARWLQWDAHHYLFLAVHGYVTTGDERNYIAFFPLYPAVIAILGHVGVPLALAPLLVSNVASLLATILLFEIARRDGDVPSAWRAAALWNLFPTAYFLFNGYSEGLFSTLAFGCVLAARYRHWLIGGALGGLAAATRLTGFALLPLLLVEIYMVRPTLHRLWRALLPLALVPVGLFSYLWINWRVLGNPFAFIEVQLVRWYRYPSPPWVGGAEAIRGIFERPPWESLTVGAGEFVAGLGAYVVSGLSWLKLRPGDAIYATIVTAVVTFQSFWLSNPRFLLTVFPLFLLAGRVQNPFLQGLGAALSLVGLVVFSVAFTRGLWAF